MFTSGYALETLVEQGRAHAQSIVLTKPYRNAELAQRLREAFARRPCRRRSACSRGLGPEPRASWLAKSGRFWPISRQNTPFGVPAMVPFFVQIKCKLGQSYTVANAFAEAEIASEIYSTAGITICW
ncbi:MAG: hypothetical protein QM811_21120 [Pirellulales bacterium]